MSFHSHLLFLSQCYNHRPFHRVGYYLELQHPKYGNKWIYTEFDAFTDDPNLVGIPIQNDKYQVCR